MSTLPPIELKSPRPNFNQNHFVFNGNDEVNRFYNSVVKSRPLNIKRSLFVKKPLLITRRFSL